MQIGFYGYPQQIETWLQPLRQALPTAAIRVLSTNDQAAADYLLVRNPPATLLDQRELLKAIFNLGAGIDYLAQLRTREVTPALHNVPLIRLEDAGMAEQMRDYVTHWVLHFFRGFHQYQTQQQAMHWYALPTPQKSDFTVGILGGGQLGHTIALHLQALGFPVRVWKRQPDPQAPYSCWHGMEQLAVFAENASALVNVLPLTATTQGILNRALFQACRRGAYLINVARGQHLVEDDLIQALQDGQLAGACLDVFTQEPLANHHPFWATPNLFITPHCSADNVPQASMQQIAHKIQQIEAGQTVTGIVDWTRGY